MSCEGFRGYIFSRPFQGERVPQNVQNLVIRDFAARSRLTYLLSATEYAMPGCFMMLEQVLAELPALEGMICYSIFQLPPDGRARHGEVVQFFEEHPTPSAARTIQQSLERIRLNVRWLERNRDAVGEWLAAR